MQRSFTVALVGNPNAGKTTVFNALTGARQTIGNWPGVTVERKEGFCLLPDGTRLSVVDLPGIYSLMAASEDERVAVDFIVSGGADLFINVIDGSNLERNLYLTLLLAELKVPTLHVLTMMDIADDRGISIDLQHLERHLGAPVFAGDLRDRAGGRTLMLKLQEALAHPAPPTLAVTYSPVVEQEIARLTPVCEAASDRLKLPARWLAIQLLEADPAIVARMQSAVTEAELAEAEQRIKAASGEFSDEAFANGRYAVIQGLCSDVITRHDARVYATQRVDRWILNRWLGIPFFLLVMFIVFWLTQTVGGAFIDAFDLLGGTLFVEVPRLILERLHAPPVVIALVANGLGAGLQTMATFLPPIFFMFLCLALLEDSGYMARAAFVMDRAMKWLGLPGKSFVPLLVGFGCSVPAILATRTLESRRDRLLTIFMIPFMSCGAKLPVYVVFGAAFFADNPGRLVFRIYVTGMVLGILTGLLLKHTLFTGAPSHFIMELPPYHLPRMKYILLNVWDRLRSFIFRAGKVIVPMVLLLGLLNTLGRDGTLGNENTRNSLLTSVGVTMTPVFGPMGIERDNWPATVAIFSGLFAKEAVIGTLNSIYGQNTSREEIPAGERPCGQNLWLVVGRGVVAAWRTIPENLGAILCPLKRLFGCEKAEPESAAAAVPCQADESLFIAMRGAFSKGRHQAFAYLLFVLLYVPCIAAMGAALRELGHFYGVVLMVYLTVLGWCVATLYYQITVAHQWIWMATPCALLLAMAGGFHLMGRYRRIPLI
ncbi:MAG: ferrous iron transport protein B [Lentisphaerae bacterium]|jgi:ferrous iron transport protein B|nr:ferrous iron transport protein B [Lentisphaerota bacterium]